MWKKRMCYYTRNTSRADALMLTEFVNFCDRAATQQIFLICWQSKKRWICESSECWEKARKDLNILKKEWERKQEISKKVNELRKIGVSDAEIWQRWDYLQ